MGKAKHIHVAFGTRPEVIKLAPVIAALRRHPELFSVTAVSTGQHREMLRQELDAFALRPDIDLRLMEPDQSLSGLTARIVTAMDGLFAANPPDMLLVQGDTTTVFASALAAFYRNIPVGHIEAGLRSHDLQNPFPEEANRKLVSTLASVHFAPTQHAADNLLAENIPRARIVVTGNTVVDALQFMAKHARPLAQELAPLEQDLTGRRLLLVTAHRRESQGKQMEEVCQAVSRLVRTTPDLVAAFPVHLNPRVREVVYAVLAGQERVHLLPPLGYPDFVRLMQRASLILTDSGGVQEEAPTFSVPVMVLRKLTERPEAMENGQALVVGTQAETICGTAREILSQGALWQRMRHAGNPFGDGRASERIATALRRHFAGADALLPASEHFSFSPWPQQTAKPEEVLP